MFFALNDVCINDTSWFFLLIYYYLYNKETVFNDILLRFMRFLNTCTCFLKNIWFFLSGFIVVESLYSLLVHAHVSVYVLNVIVTYLLVAFLLHGHFQPFLGYM